MQTDVVIVGAGAAGIGAGLALKEQGRSFVILEAANRVGGRAYTDKTSLSEPWDHGCHWFHCADVNPLVPWGVRLGADFDREDRSYGSIHWVGGRWLDAAEIADARAASNAAFDAIYNLPKDGPDCPVSELLPKDGPWAKNIRYVFRLMASCDPEEDSSHGYADYADTEVNYVVRSGLGDLIARMAEGLPIRLNMPVTRIEQRAGGVRVVTGSGAIDAKAAIVTVSTNVLNSGAIGFDSTGANAILDIVADVPCGSYEKIAITLRRLPVDTGDAEFCWIDPGEGQALSFELAPTKSPMLIAHVGGSDVRALLKSGREAMIDLATERLAAAFGASIRAEITGAEVTGWQANPYVRGAYSYTRPGLSSKRREMIAAESGDIHFAGEAFSLPWHATAHGAYQTGVDASARVAARLK